MTGIASNRWLRLAVLPAVVAALMSFGPREAADLKGVPKLELGNEG